MNVCVFHLEKGEINMVRLSRALKCLSVLIITWVLIKRITRHHRDSASLNEEARNDNSSKETPFSNINNSNNNNNNNRTSMFNDKAAKNVIIVLAYARFVLYFNESTFSHER